MGVNYGGENTVEDRHLGEINNNKSQKFVQPSLNNVG